MNRLSRRRHPFPRSAHQPFAFEFDYERACETIVLRSGADDIAEAFDGLEWLVYHKRGGLVINLDRGHDDDDTDKWIEACFIPRELVMTREWKRGWALAVRINNRRRAHALLFVQNELTLFVAQLSVPRGPSTLPPLDSLSTPSHDMFTRWSNWIWNPTLSDIDPQEGVPRVGRLVGTFDRFRLKHRVGMRFAPDFGFWSTPLGQLEYERSMQQISDAIRETLMHRSFVSFVAEA